MKNLFLAVLSSLLLSCSNDSQTTTKSVTERTTEAVTPVRLSSALWNKKSGKCYVNFQWHSDYGYPLFIYLPNYVTIYQDGILKEIEYYGQDHLNRYSVRVSNQWTTSTFVIIQTVIGVGISEPFSFTVSKPLNTKQSDRELTLNVTR